MNSLITKKFIKKLEKQEEKIHVDYERVLNQWHGSLFLFAGLAMAALSNQSNICADILIVLWLLSSLFLLAMFYYSNKGYKLSLIYHYESVPPEQEQNDYNRTEKKVRFFEKYSNALVLISIFFTMLYFVNKIFDLIEINSPLCFS
jgi:hypothetical protein